MAVVGTKGFGKGFYGIAVKFGNVYMVSFRIPHEVVQTLYDPHEYPRDGEYRIVTLDVCSTEIKLA